MDKRAARTIGEMDAHLRWGNQREMGRKRGEGGRGEEFCELKFTVHTLGCKLPRVDEICSSILCLASLWPCPERKDWYGNGKRS